MPRLNRKPKRRYAKRKTKNEPSTEAGVWFQCSDEQYVRFEAAATREGFKWVNRWALVHLGAVCRLQRSTAQAFPDTGKTADHVQPWNREGTGIWIDSPGRFDEFTRQATVEGFRTVLEWGLYHLEQMADRRETVPVVPEAAAA